MNIDFKKYFSIFTYLIMALVTISSAIATTNLAEGYNPYQESNQGLFYITTTPTDTCSDCGDGTWNCDGVYDNRCGNNGQIGGIIKADQSCLVNNDKRFMCKNTKWYSCSESGTWVWTDEDLGPGQKTDDNARCCDPSQIGNKKWSFCGDGKCNDVCGETDSSCLQDCDRCVSEGHQRCTEPGCNIGHPICNPNPPSKTQNVPAGQVCTFTGIVRNSGCTWQEPAHMTITGNGCNKVITYPDCDEKPYTATCYEGTVTFSADDSSYFTLDDPDCEDIECTDDSDCNDELYCNGEETCNLDTYTCEDGTPVDCDDGVSCTDDSCNEQTDSCYNTPNDNLCDNGLYCDGTEYCDAYTGCQSGTSIDCSDNLYCTVNERCDETFDTCLYDDRDCSGNDLPEITTCYNNPDDNPYTWDYASGFTSDCNEDLDICTSGSYTYTHTCEESCGADPECDGLEPGTGDCSQTCQYEPEPICGNGIIEPGEECDDGSSNDIPCTPDYDNSCNYCSNECTIITLDGPYCGDGTVQLGYEECEYNFDCEDTDCDYLDGCIGNDYYDYHDAENDCLCDCSCESNSCTGYTIYENDPSCTECTTHDDCNDLDDDYCYEDLIIHEEGRCINYECITEIMLVEDCSYLDNVYCEGTEIKHDDYTCYEEACILDSTTTLTDCSDELYCNGQETCNNANCVPGTPIDCSGNDITEVSECSYSPDNIDYTLDYRGAFTSECVEPGVCTQGDDTITHTCDTTCEAECVDNLDCDDENELTNDYCVACICEHEKIPYCGDNYIDEGEECDTNNLNGKSCLDFYEIISNTLVYFIDGNLLCYECNFDTSQCILPDCADSIDNDNDGLIDYPNDPGCGAYYDNDEKNPWPECMDNIDNDNDGFIDYPNDPDCKSKFDDKEAPDKLLSGLTVKRISFVNEDRLRGGDELLLVVTLYNDGDINLKQLKITATAYDLGIKKSTRRFDLKKNQLVTKAILLDDIPVNVKLGNYDIRITVSNDILTRVVHRPVEIVKCQKCSISEHDQKPKRFLT